MSIEANHSRINDRLRLRKNGRRAATAAVLALVTAGASDALGQSTPSTVKDRAINERFYGGQPPNTTAGAVARLRRMIRDGKNVRALNQTYNVMVPSAGASKGTEQCVATRPIAMRVGQYPESRRDLSLFVLRKDENPGTTTRNDVKINSVSLTIEPLGRRSELDKPQNLDAPVNFEAHGTTTSKDKGLLLGPISVNTSPGKTEIFMYGRQTLGTGPAALSVAALASCIEANAPNQPMPAGV